MDPESSLNQFADRLTIDRRDLERAFLSIFDQLTGAHPKRMPGQYRNTCCASGDRNHRCCCIPTNEAPSFSVLLGNSSCCNAHNSSCRTAGNSGKVLQIHLPETSKDPCQILVTSHRGEVTVKYLQQGQQFTFSSNEPDRTIPKTTPSSDTCDRHLSKRDDDRLFSNRENDRTFSNSHNDEMFSNDNGNTFDSASKSPLSVTIDRVFSKAQLDRVFPNIESTDGMLSDAANNRTLSNDGNSGEMPSSVKNRMMSNETNGMMSNEPNRMMSNKANRMSNDTNRMMSDLQTRRRLSNGRNDHVFQRTESGESHMDIQQNGLPTNKITDPNEFLQNEGISSKHEMGTTRNTLNRLIRNNKASQLEFASEINVSQAHKQASLTTGNFTTSPESVRAEKPHNSDTTTHASSSSSERNRNDFGVLATSAHAAMDDDNDDDDGNQDFPPAKKQKKQSLNTFIDSLLTKRTREENRKTLEHFDNTSSRPDRRSFDISRPKTDLEQIDQTENVDDPGSLVVVDPNEPIATLFGNGSLADTEPTRLPLPSDTDNPSAVFQSSDLEKTSTVKKKRFKCQYCSAMFQERDECLIHISKEHMEERPHKCPLCNATFKKTRSLRYHIRHHNGERPYKCTYCEKAFKEKYHLTVHIRTHTNERPFACMQCGKAFKQTNELTSHIRTHSGERPHRCEFCNKSFKRKRQLYNHNLIHLHKIAIDTTKSQDNVVVSLDTSIKSKIASLQHSKPTELQTI